MPWYFPWWLSLKGSVATTNSIDDVNNTVNNNVNTDAQQQQQEQEGEEGEEGDANNNNSSFRDVPYQPGTTLFDCGSGTSPLLPHVDHSRLNLPIHQLKPTNRPPSFKIPATLMDKPPYLVLCMDGGGLRGIITCILLQKLEDRVPGLLEHVLFFAGTSTGSILASGLACGRKPSEVLEMYLKLGPEVFSESYFTEFKDANGFVGSRHPNGQVAMKQHLDDAFGERTLEELERFILIPTFDIGTPANASTGMGMRKWGPVFLHNMAAHGQPETCIVDAILRSSAAPTYFPSYQNCIDGGIVANDPSMIALTHILSGTSISLHDIVMISVGTGEFDQCLKPGSHDWGVAQWISPLLDVLFDGMSDQVAFQCQAMLKDNYRRINVELPLPIQLDDPRKMDMLIDIANAYDIEDDVKWVKSIFPHL